MAKPKRKKKKPGGSGPPAVDPAAALRELDARLAELKADPHEPGPVWGQVHQLLLKAKADPAAVMSLIASRDVDGLAHTIASLRGETVDEGDATAAAEAAAEEPKAADIPPETLKRAMRAFRKRVKLTRLDHESRINVSPLTSGRKASFDAITAPQEFPREVWDALADAGELQRVGQGFYMLPEGGASS